MRGEILLAAILLASPVFADSPGISARRLLASWKDQDPSMRMLAEVIASAFSSGLSWRGSLGGKAVFCPPPGLKGGQVRAPSAGSSRIIPKWRKRPTETRWRRRSVESFLCQVK